MTIRKSHELRSWTVDDSADLYQIAAWSDDYFSIGREGQIVVHPEGSGTSQIGLYEIVNDLVRRGYELPMLLRFSDILRHRVQAISGSFEKAISEYGYQGGYRPVYPIKVNQQRDVVEELVEFGAGNGLGLEAGSKPELLIALAYMDSEDGLIVCNGYKDFGYIQTALLAQKLGRHTILVIDRFEELDLIMRVSRQLGIRPHIGVRSRLTTRGAGKWVESSGDRSKFGLSASELVSVVERLREASFLDCLELLHFHIGSQITAIRSVKDAVREASRVFTELVTMGAGLKFIDVGGGLAVDYDGSKSNFHSSANYTLQEYANDIVAQIQEECNQKNIHHPDIISESGRALVAHHAVLVFDVVGRSRPEVETPPAHSAEHESSVVRGLFETYQALTPKNYQESFHDAIAQKEEAQSLFRLGFLDLKGRALAEQIFSAICLQLRRIIRDCEYVPDELGGLERALAETVYCNFSVFQSLPDHWAVDQLFPMMPIHRLDEEPKSRAILADLTCDSDGKVAEFIDMHGTKHTLELHENVSGEPYLLAAFLVGAYQEILGDLHNLFGDTHAIHVRLRPEGGYDIQRVVEGDSIEEVLCYVQYGREELLQRVRNAAESAVRQGRLTFEELALLMQRYNEALSGYTYLTRETPMRQVPQSTVSTLAVDH